MFHLHAVFLVSVSFSHTNVGELNLVGLRLHNIMWTVISNHFHNFQLCWDNTLKYSVMLSPYFFSKTLLYV